MRKATKSILAIAAASSLIACGQVRGKSQPEASAEILRDTCVTFSSGSTFGKWLSDKILEHPFSEEDFYDASGERQSDFDLSFTIDENGDISGIRIKHTDSTDTSGYSNVQKYLISLLEDAPAWNPAVSEGVRTSTPMSLNVRIMPYEKAYETIYSRFDTSSKRQIPYKEGQNYVMVSSLFRYGTHNDMMRWISENIKYPEEARKKKIEGKVYVCGLLDSLGRLRDLKTMDAPGFSDNALLADSALKTLAAMPQQDPYYENGHPMEITFAIPLVFKAE